MKCLTRMSSHFHQPQLHFVVSCNPRNSITIIAAYHALWCEPSCQSNSVFNYSHTKPLQFLSRVKNEMLTVFSSYFLSRRFKQYNYPRAGYLIKFSIKISASKYCQSQRTFIEITWLMVHICFTMIFSFWSYKCCYKSRSPFSFTAAFFTRPKSPNPISAKLWSKDDSTASFGSSGRDVSSTLWQFQNHTQIS